MRLPIILAFLLLGSIVDGQELHAYWQPDSIPLGGQTKLNVVLKYAPTNVVFSPDKRAFDCDFRFSNQTNWQSNGRLEILSFQDTVFKKKGIMYWKGSYVVTAWDTALYRIPKIELAVAKKSLEVQPGLLRVGFIKKKVSDSIEEVPVPSVKNTFGWTWFVLLLSVMFLATLIVIVVRKKRKKEKVQPSLKARTLAQIAALEHKQLWKNGQLDEHYVAFALLLKTFLGTAFAISLKERTTQEVQLLLRAKKLDETIIQQINELLHEADLIKFGKVINQEEHIQYQLDRLRTLVEFICPIETPLV
jgi:hypothetical protein